MSAAKAEADHSHFLMVNSLESRCFVLPSVGDRSPLFWRESCELLLVSDAARPRDSVAARISSSRTSDDRDVARSDGFMISVNLEVVMLSEGGGSGVSECCTG